jgi:hypothetical protein
VIHLKITVKRYGVHYKDAVDILFNLPNTVMNYGRILLSGSLYIYVDDVDGLWEKIKDKVEVVYHPKISYIRCGSSG